MAANGGVRTGSSVGAAFDFSGHKRQAPNLLGTRPRMALPSVNEPSTALAAIPVSQYVRRPLRGAAPGYWFLRRGLVARRQDDQEAQRGERNSQLLQLVPSADWDSGVVDRNADEEPSAPVPAGARLRSRRRRCGRRRRVTVSDGSDDDATGQVVSDCCRAGGRILVRA
jgi:hypothetical protein